MKKLLALMGVLLSPFIYMISITVIAVCRLYTIVAFHKWIVKVVVIFAVIALATRIVPFAIKPVSDFVNPFLYYKEAQDKRVKALEDDLGKARLNYGYYYNLLQERNGENSELKSEIDELEKSLNNKDSEIKTLKNKESIAKSYKSTQAGRKNLGLITIGSTKADCVKVLGQPRSMNEYIWFYSGYDDVQFSTDGKVSGWSNSSGRLRVKY
jgi:regulator of replication initiation timing